MESNIKLRLASPEELKDEQPFFNSDDIFVFYYHVGKDLIAKTVTILRPVQYDFPSQIAMSCIEGWERISRGKYLFIAGLIMFEKIDLDAYVKALLDSLEAIARERKLTTIYFQIEEDSLFVDIFIKYGFKDTSYNLSVLGKNFPLFKKLL